MSAISEKIQRILRSRVNTETDPSSNSEEQLSESRIKLREILSEQHRLMCYTVTVSTLSPHHLPRLRKDSRNLKWQFASTLYKSQIFPAGDDEKINHQLPELLQHRVLG